MFKNLTNFGYTRTLKEAIGFYIAYLILTVLVAGLLGGVVGGLSASEEVAFETGLRLGYFAAVTFSLVLGFLVAKSKKILGNFVNWILIVIGGILALFGGALLGLIPVAYLTTRS